MPFAVLFDLDGTLVDSAADIARALSSLRCARGGTAIATADVRPLVSLGAATLVEQALGALATNNTDDLAEFRTILGALPPDPTTVYSGVAAVLGRLPACGHRLAIVTNKPEALSRSLLTQLGLTDYFAAIVGGDTTANAKPHPDPLLKALETIGISSDNAIFVGDSPVDAQAAAACAIPFILFEGGYGVEECANETVHARFAQFAALPAIISGIADERNFMIAANRPTG